MSSKLLRGTFVLTLGTYISRILGMVYLIPFSIMVGATGGALFQYGYNQYTLFLNIATMGFPAAVSKFVSKYNSKGDYETSRKMLKAGMSVMLVTGMIAFFILYLSAPMFAEISLGGKDNNGLTIDHVVYVIRMVSLALLVVPIMSLVRGFFQGHQMMGPTAVSQVVEQIVRIIFLLSATFLILKVFNGGLVIAVGYATFAALIGAFGGLVVLYIYWNKRKGSLLAMMPNTGPTANLSYKKMFFELFSYAAPYVFVGLAIPLYNYIDTNTFNKAMIEAGHQAISQDMLAILTLYVQKLVMIPVSLATAFGLTLIPTITESFTSGNYKLLNQQINQTMQTILFLIIPAVVGISLLSGPTYTFFYGSESLHPELGANILLWYSPVAILFSLFTVNAAILQGINKQKFAVVSLVIGVVIKLVLNVPLIKLMQADGAILATALGYIASLLYGFIMIKRHAGYSYKILVKRTVLMLVLSAIMGIAVKIVQWVLGFFISYQDGQLQAAIVVVIAAAVGGAVYLYCGYRLGFLQKILGRRLPGFLRKGRHAG
ncbi:lipid II flippase MurJ [Bacillus subtilis]|jgi:Membrane protein involved in the export of O-antigen and teichoic acid|uniref:Lipid II flippase MurJ n=2 Tax=Bacillus subtilis TaxID=1423 RepID=A0A8I1WC75_BACIU|nr:MULTISPECIES: lipid II flippase MurJ [Bacillus]AXC54022.1 polysaccharide biosynthesis protein [Bacillus spizizenii]MDP4123922.1 lipid II flippase MurJ [Bacillota bacterium]CJR43445.1 polysaccharide transporter [Streptococcus pneumoniae]ADV93802.1 putative enzyme involved in polysaccharide biosynthesis [Bacillus subtilis BSn5]AGE64601.1 putative enzyme involved in polysaccharide biosynthesis [Bacillus subtilis XF-1]